MRGSIHTKILKDGKTKTYEAHIRLNAKQVGKRFRRRKDAEDWLDRHSVDVREGTYRELNKGTFRDYIDHWKTTHLSEVIYKPSTLNGYRCDLEKHLLPHFGPYPMAAISSAEINQLQAKMLKAGLTPKTVRNTLNLLGKIFKDAISDHYLRHSPMEGVRLPKVDKEQKGRALKPEEIMAILGHCDVRFRPIFLTAVLTGMRRGEVFGLMWPDLEWEQNVLQVRRALYWKHGKYNADVERAEGVDAPEPASTSARYMFVAPKSKKSIRAIDLSPTLKRELLELWISRGKPQEGLVFCTAKGTPLTPENIVKRNFHKALRQAGLGRVEEITDKKGRKRQRFYPEVRWHDLRHTYGSVKLAQGENIYYVQRQMGHSSIQVTADIYGHLLNDRNPEAAAKTDQLLFGSKA